MGITKEALQLLKPYLLPGKTVLALGAPQFTVSISDLTALFPEIWGKQLELDHKAAQWHKLDFLPATFYSFARALNLGRVDVLDTHAWSGFEIIGDLNNDLDKFRWNIGARYDVVIDHGTIEHCMNIGQALLNCANLTAPGGIVFHGSPVTMVNHGFYNVCPGLFHDFYRGNGWTVQEHRLTSATGHSVEILEDPFSRQMINPECSQLFIARKTLGAVKSHPRFFMQTKYRKQLEKK